MARKQKVPNHIKKFLERGVRRRREGTKPVRKYFLIVCEGVKTEPLYFEAFKADLPKGVLDIDIEGEGKNTQSLVEAIIRIKEKREKASGRQYDQVWAVFDRDSFPPQNFNAAIFKARSAKPEILCAWSNEAFELWYLLHFEFYQDAASRKQYQERLEQALSRRMGKPFEYRKNDPQLYALLRDFGNLEQAILWAMELEERHAGEDFANHNPCTLVYKLVKALKELADPKS